MTEYQMKKAIVLILAISCVLGLIGCNNTQPSYKEPEFFYYYNFEAANGTTDTIQETLNKYGENKEITPVPAQNVLTNTEIPKAENNAKGPDPICIVFPDLDLSKYDGPYIWTDEATGLEVSTYYRVVAGMLTDEIVKVFVDSDGNILEYEATNLGKYDSLNLDTEKMEYMRIAFDDYINATLRDIRQEQIAPTQHLGPSVYELFINEQGQVVVCTTMVIKDTATQVKLYSVANAQ